jgi:hypothetical protein
MNVLHLSPLVGFAGFGVSQAALSLASAQREQGHEVEI